MGPSSWGYNVTMHFGKVQPLQGLRSKVSERERGRERGPRPELNQRGLWFGLGLAED